MSRLLNARTAVLQLFALNAHSRNEDARKALNAALDEVEEAATEYAHGPDESAAPLNPLSEAGGEPDASMTPVADVVGTDANGAPIIAEVPPPPPVPAAAPPVATSNAPASPQPPAGGGKGGSHSKAKTANK